jgi:hypothetical protein
MQPLTNRSIHQTNEIEIHAGRSDAGTTCSSWRAQSGTIERAGQAAKHFVASLHPVTISIVKIADKPHYVK